jgi:hypothetical protein
MYNIHFLSTKDGRYVYIRLSFDSERMILFPEDSQKVVNIRKSNRFLQAAFLTLLHINYQNGIVGPN